MKRAMSRGQRNSDGNATNHFTSKKIFVGGLSSSLTEEEFKNYFERFGRITDVVVMHDSATRRPRGFGFITFESEESVQHVLQNNFYELNGKQVEVKKAVPKEANNSYKNGYNIRMGGRRASSFPQYGHNLPYPPASGYEMAPHYYPYSLYGCVENYCYATSMYPGGYFMGESGGAEYGSTPFRHPWNVPGTLGSPIVYPPYSSGRVGLLDRVAGSTNDVAGPSTISRSQADVIPTPSQIDSSLKDSNGNVNPVSLVPNNSDGGKLDTVCDGEVCDSAGENSGCGSLKEDGAASSHLRIDSLLKDTNGNGNPPSLAPNNSDGGKLDTVCDGEVCDSAGENSGCGSLKEDGAASSHLRIDYLLKDTNGNGNSPSLVPHNSDGGKLHTVCDSAGGNSGCGSLNEDGAASSHLRIGSSLKDTNGNVNPPFMPNNSDGGKLDTVCVGEVCDSAVDDSGCGSLKEDGVASSHLKEDGCESSSPLKVNCVASTSDPKEDGIPSDFFDVDAPPSIKDGGAASSSGLYDDAATCSLDRDTDTLKCNGAAYSSCNIQNLKELEEQLTPSPDCDSCCHFILQQEVDNY